MSSEKVSVFEVGPRDGLQNEKNILPLADKLWLIDSLSQAGMREIETGAFVRPDKVPQMADTEQVHDELKKRGTSGNFWYLVPNLKGLERALQKGVTHVALFTAVSDTFNQKNIGMTVRASLDEMKKILSEAKKHSLHTRGYVSTVWGCPFEGRIAPSQAIPVLEEVLAMGVDQLSIGDTIGVAAPKGVTEILAPLIQNHTAQKIAVHFHDTRGTALANTVRAIELGVRTFDSSLGGLGGCPFAPGAAGNLATEDLVYLLKEMGFDHGIDYSRLCETSVELFKRMNKTVTSKAVQAFVANCTRNSAWDRS